MKCILTLKQFVINLSESLSLPLIVYKMLISGLGVFTVALLVNKSLSESYS